MREGYFLSFQFSFCFIPKRKKNVEGISKGQRGKDMAVRLHVAFSMPYFILVRHCTMFSETSLGIQSTLDGK